MKPSAGVAALLVSIIALIACSSDDAAGSNGTSKPTVYCYAVSDVAKTGTCTCSTSPRTSLFDSGYHEVSDCGSSIAPGSFCCASIDDKTGEATSCDCQRPYCATSTTFLKGKTTCYCRSGNPDGSGGTDPAATEVDSCAPQGGVCCSGSTCFCDSTVTNCYADDAQTHEVNSCSPSGLNAACPSGQRQVSSCSDLTFLPPSSGGGGGGGGTKCKESGASCSSSGDCCSTCNMDQSSALYHTCE